MDSMVQKGQSPSGLLPKYCTGSYPYFSETETGLCWGRYTSAEHMKSPQGLKVLKKKTQMF
jgi:hypothetical protein